MLRVIHVLTPSYPTRRSSDLLAGEPRVELKLEAGRGMPAGHDGLWWSLAAMGAALAGAALWLQPRRAVAVTAVMTAVLWCGWGLAIAPQLDGESSSRDLMPIGRAHV